MTPLYNLGVMADVKIRNLDPQIVKAFKVRAKAAGRSLEADLRETLSSHLRQSRAPLLEKFDSLRANSPPARANAANTGGTLDEIRQAMSRVSRAKVRTGFSQKRCDNKQKDPIDHKK
jgi:plasmid stability protein